jgi:twitching motility protein PilT
VWVIEDLLQQMATLGASDLLLTAGSPPQYRVLGALRPLGDQALRAEDTEQLGFSLLNPEQAGRLRTERSLDLSKSIGTRDRFRFNLYYQRDALALVARLIPSVIPPFEELGLPPILSDLAMRPHGLILVTGPAGSGKSTTLAAMINYINDHRAAHVVCIEDPIEYVHAHRRSVIDQREIGQDAASFSEALRSVFRQSPDVIMIGEMRDLETMQLALTLAETGHLILATLHTQDTTHAINRIVDVFPPSHQQQVYTQLSMVLSAVLSQALLVTADGKRRVLACEVMNVNAAIRNLIRESQPQQIYAVIQTGRADGMITMNDSLRSLCATGVLDPQVALMRSPRPKEFARMMETLTRQRGVAS